MSPRTSIDSLKWLGPDEAEAEVEFWSGPLAAGGFGVKCARTKEGWQVTMDTEKPIWVS